MKFTGYYFDIKGAKEQPVFLNAKDIKSIAILLQYGTKCGEHLTEVFKIIKLINVKYANCGEWQKANYRCSMVAKQHNVHVTDSENDVVVNIESHIKTVLYIIIK